MYGDHRDLNLLTHAFPTRRSSDLGRIRGDATYQSRRKLARASLSRGSDNNVGSLGYSVNVQDSSGNTSIDGVVDYIANRFDARVSLATAGTSLGGITDDRTARLQIGKIGRAHV